MEPADKETLLPNFDQFSHHVIKATMWFGNPYMPWHDPRVPGGKWGQELVISADGQCVIQNKVFNRDVKQSITGQPAEQLQIPQKAAQDLLQELAATVNFCGQPADKENQNQTSSVTLENDHDDQIVFVHFNDTEPLAINRLSMKIRDLLNRADLLVMDGCGRDDFIEKLTVTFNDPDDYREKLVVTRADETIAYQRWGTDGSDVTTTFHLPDNVSTVLDSLVPADFTETIPGVPKDATDDVGTFGHFTCELTQRNLQPIHFAGDYEKFCLPDNWSRLMEVLAKMMNVPVLGAIMSPEFYNQRRRRESDVIYLSVNFGHSSREYNYLTDDDSITVGDYVVVPVGEDNERQIVEVTGKHYYQRDEVPYPLDRIKKVIGLADVENDGDETEPDFENYD